MPETIKYDRQNYDIDQLDSHWADVQIVRMIGRGKTVLELGCATGYIGKFLKEKRGCVVYGIELNETAAAQAAPYYEKILSGDASQLNLYGNFRTQFDIILCSNVLEHLPNPGAVLRTLKSSLKEGGCFVIALPNIAHWTIRLQILLGKFDYTPSGILDESHLKFFTLKTARSLIQDAGLAIQEFSFDWDNGLPKFNGLFLRVPRIGPWFLKQFYSLSPTLFGYQFIFKASPQKVR
ncbi:MAG: class I SAM-dependent methyltransferase [Elusimicrobia bacterium]|nr:class I SAM-dependent methyltransferase [Elusimicrobiota bacterium]